VRSQARIGDYYLPLERYRGLDDREDHLLAAEFRKQLTLGQSLTIALSTNRDAVASPEQARSRQDDHQAMVIRRWKESNAELASTAPDWVRQLALAADQFIVKRPLADEPEGRSVHRAGVDCGGNAASMAIPPAPTRAANERPVFGHIEENP